MVVRCARNWLLLCLFFLLAGCSMHQRLDASKASELNMLLAPIDDNLLQNQEYLTLLETHRIVQGDYRPRVVEDTLFLNHCSGELFVSTWVDREKNLHIREMDELAFMQVTLEGHGFPQDVINSVFSRIQISRKAQHSLNISAPADLQLVVPRTRQLPEGQPDTFFDAYIFSKSGETDLLLISAGDHIRAMVPSLINYVSHQLDLDVPNTNVYTACGGGIPSVRVTSTPNDADLYYISKFRHRYCDRIGVDADDPKMCQYWDALGDAAEILSISGRLVVAAYWNDGTNKIKSFDLDRLPVRPRNDPSGVKTINLRR